MASAVTSRKYFALQTGANRFITCQAWTLQVTVGLFIYLFILYCVQRRGQSITEDYEQIFRTCIKDKITFENIFLILEFPIKMLTLLIPSWDHCPWTHFSLSHQNCISSR